jgi:hypothetical protein
MRYVAVTVQEPIAGHVMLYPAGLSQSVVF